MAATVRRDAAIEQDSQIIRIVKGVLLIATGAPPRRDKKMKITNLLRSVIVRASAGVLLMAAFASAQNATCKDWRFFNKFVPADINDWHTIVGSAEQSSGMFTGYIRLFNGDTTTYNAPEALPTNWTFLTRRNGNGATVGWYRDPNQIAHGLLLWANKTTTIDAAQDSETIVYGINDFGTMVWRCRRFQWWAMARLQAEEKWEYCRH